VPVLFGLAGSVAGGFVADRLGRRRSIALASILLGASFVGFAALQPYWESRTVIVAITCAQSLFQGLLSASLFALFIDVSWPKVAATQFTAYMALLNLSTSAGGWVAGTVQGWFGFAGAHVALGVFQAALVLLLIPLDPHQNRRELGEEAPAPAGGG
ncbi:MAG TPA: MFS transporter, partial [Kofleriaceae bacterium]|nr:MFS transporter [Kofleriaceae bacterium]